VTADRGQTFETESTEFREAVEHSRTVFQEYPFRCVLSFEPLIASLEADMEEREDSGVHNRKALEEILSQAPQLGGPIRDRAVLRRLGPSLEKLMSMVFPSVYWETEPIAAVVPFTMEPVFVSGTFRSLFLNKDGRFAGSRNVPAESFDRGRLIRAYLLVLDKFYGIHHRFDYPLIHIVQDGQTGLERHYKMDLDFRFVGVRHTRDEGNHLEPEKHRSVHENLNNPEKLRDVLPPENFEIYGFTLLRAVDVTVTAVLSALERDLVDQESMVSTEGFLRLQERLRVLYQRKDLRAGIAALQDDQVLLLSTGGELNRNCVFQSSRHIPISEFQGTPYERAVRERSALSIPDALEEPWPENLRQDIEERGVRSLIIAPLYYKGDCIGNLDLSADEPGAFGPMDLLVTEQLQPLFAVAVQRSLSDLHSRIEGLIKQECTAIHPTVEWRFRKAALNYLEAARQGKTPELEPIVFKNVYPLYAVSDIRGSAGARNQAIQKDLARHLELASTVIQKACEEKPLLFLRELARRVEGTRERVLTELGSGDEVSVLHFLKTEVERFFGELAEMAPRVRGAVEDYYREVDARTGTVYSLRTAFEESVTLLNDRLVTYLDGEELKAQGLFPHYFERHRTDGVDYILYIGDALNETPGFSELYLRDLRLWQLRVSCGMAWHTEDLKKRLKVPLDTAHLILVQNAPLSIRFRYDEKRFDVDGSYDVRHEILKSRVDKARIKGNNERLTQPGKVAVVYSQLDEAREMRRHMEFLMEAGYLTGEIERHDLGDLPGVQGLKALRVAVDLDSQELARAAGASPKSMP